MVGAALPVTEVGAVGKGIVDAGCGAALYVATGAIEVDGVLRVTVRGIVTGLGTL